MHLDELETFITLVQEKNFTKTAAKRALSQPTVSVHIKNLEKEFATALIKRTTKHVSLTPEGELFYDKALQMRDLYKELQETLYEKKEQASGLIRIGASFTVGEYLLPKIIANLHADHPQLDFHITIGNTDNMIDAVRRLEVDIGLVEGTSHSKDVIQTPFQQDRLVIVRSPLSSKKIHTLTDLHEQVWIIREEGSGTRQSFDHLIQSHNIRVGATFVFSSTQAIKGSVTSGMGIALLSEASIQEELKHGTLEIIPIDGLYEERAFSYILTKGAKSSRNIQLLLEYL
ncbi:transcriptional regulator [Alkalihalobacillus alcalophilus ATCC 27647 = CGMCC 1.3604]|uniref:Transcriptional regulator n=1 Tax=Alkalihalobacillus alcalophilus ATCC 27647 = CGMCC 1.3604 TaxID=1218173 RepID=A0A094WS90_ALKAL|nr:selenium metabolism-associated LysR family transcriptional regulator [Alkalihalobacillus alcalophilus]KGA98923.1 transcriptional regulator [Alkalihalobacillus alcalophilus ATCC 27647 = CGMCC 1.3604]MED1561955.1 selenium metabolism-associated LysR family transcriptional regulator [Alkalihalobacillus alcalophilus]THG88455.1 transcriptional regulator [Alkalihalobacillus alcalophilus ATCC 27647 = CGMCC 1.3604]